MLWLSWIIRFHRTREWWLCYTWQYHHCCHNTCLQTVHVSRNSDSLWPGRPGDWLPVGVARFLVPFLTGPGAHPASYTMCTGSFPGVKQQGRGIYHPPPSSAEVKERVGLNLYSPPWTFMAYSRVSFTFSVQFSSISGNFLTLQLCRLSTEYRTMTRRRYVRIHRLVGNSCAFFYMRHRRPGLWSDGLTDTVRLCAKLGSFQEKNSISKLKSVKY